MAVGSAASVACFPKPDRFALFNYSGFFPLAKPTDPPPTPIYPDQKDATPKLARRQS
ncbi:unnamed protein product [Diplocarpon coronariae]